VWKEFNGFCNDYYEINKYRLQLPQGDLETQAIFLHAVHMMDLMTNRKRGGCFLGCNVGYFRWTTAICDETQEEKIIKAIRLLRFNVSSNDLLAFSISFGDKSQQASLKN
jgi:hypothetical protein